MSDCLVLDASGPFAHLALVRGEETIWTETVPAGRGQGGGLFAAAETACRRTDQLREIRVGTGPGSYSGCRQAIALAQGISMARGIPLFGLCSFLALETECPAITAVGDARRGMVYAAKLQGLRIIEAPRLVALEAIDNWAGPNHPIVRFDHESNTIPGDGCAMVIARFARASCELSKHPIEPLYLRPPNITQPKNRGTLLARD